MIYDNDSINEDSNDSDQPVPEFMQYCKSPKHEHKNMNRFLLLEATWSTSAITVYRRILWSLRNSLSSVGTFLSLLHLHSLQLHLHAAISKSLLLCFLKKDVIFAQYLLSFLRHLKGFSRQRYSSRNFLIICVILVWDTVGIEADCQTASYLMATILEIWLTDGSVLSFCCFISTFFL